MRDTLLAYGMGPTRLFAQLSGEGVKTTLEECQDLFRRYKETFKTTIAWLDRQKTTARRELRMTNYAGRRRWWKAPNDTWARNEIIKEITKANKGQPLTQSQEYSVVRLLDDKLKGIWAKIERDGANFMVQSGNAEWTKDAMYHVRKECRARGYDAKMYNSVYDEIVLDCAGKDAVEIHELQKKIMIREGQKYLKQVPVDVEGHLKTYWTK